MALESIEGFVPERNFKEIALNVARIMGIDCTDDVFSYDNKQYRVERYNDSHHEWGSGGYRSNRVVLRYNGEKIEDLIESEDYDSWDTTSDDSMDYSGPSRQTTSLNSSNPFTLALFRELKHFLEKKN